MRASWDSTLPLIEASALLPRRSWLGHPAPMRFRSTANHANLTAVKDVHNVVQGEVRQFETKTGETVYTSEIPIPIALGGRLDLVSVYPVETGAVSELDTLVAQTDWTANTAADGYGEQSHVTGGYRH